jgi:hypothetical protein
MSRFRRVSATAAVLSLGLLWPAVSAGDSSGAHFQYANSSINSNTFALEVAFREVGLGSTTSTEHVTLTVQDAKATYECINGGGKHPRAANKETVSSSLDTTGTFRVRNGQTSGTISAGPPGPGGFSCPGGQRLVLDSVSYSGIYVTGPSGDTREASPDPISSN